MLTELKKSVCEANLELFSRGIVLYTWGNVSGISEDRSFMVIKPSGLSYEEMTPEDMVVVDVATGKTVEGKWKPSSDTPTHLALYRRCPELCAVAHTHSTHAVVFAQAGRDIPALGTTHADYFYGSVPCTRSLTETEVQEEYEANTGKVILETIDALGYSPLQIPGILVQNHGPFTWGTDPANAVFHSVVLEAVAEMAFKTLLLNPSASMDGYVLEKHYQRKHGPKAYYGQT